MRIPCISCQSLIRLDSSLLKSTDSLVRCSICKYIFMVYSPAPNEDPITRETNIDQSILFDLFKVEQEARVMDALQENSKSMNRPVDDEVASMDDYRDKDSECEAEGVESGDLPDLSEFEEMIDWDDVSDSEDSVDAQPQSYDDGNSTDINKI